MGYWQCSMAGLAMNKLFWKNKRILVTGSSGFKGSWLTLLLKHLGADVKGYSLLDTPPTNLIFTEIRKQNISDQKFADINNTQELNAFVEGFQPQIIFHLAAQPLVLESYKNPVLTWNTNVMGSLNLLEACRSLQEKCAVVMVTTDKVYKNNEWLYNYREIDELGGDDPYSASKAAAEIAIKSWYKSFCGSETHQTSLLRIGTARAGNVIGGGDWANYRILPDIAKAYQANRTIHLRNPHSRRPWQHVLEPLIGYLMLAEHLFENKSQLFESFNFGPENNSNKTVLEITQFIHSISKIKYTFDDSTQHLHEAKLLHLQSLKANQILNWYPIWDFEETILRTWNWYRNHIENLILSVMDLVIWI